MAKISRQPQRQEIANLKRKVNQAIQISLGLIDV